MSSDESILQQLEQDPGNWDLRIRVIEDAVRGNDMDEARRLVRESPDDIIPEDEIKVRLHALLTGGPAALGVAETEAVAEKAEPDKEPESEPVKKNPKEVRRDEESLDCVFLDREKLPGRAVCKVYERAAGMRPAQSEL